jgi:hypothetical protein
MTILDQAHAVMQEKPDDEAARLKFYERLISSQLYMALEEEPEGDTLKPLFIPLEEVTYALVFDTQARMGEFTKEPTAYAAMSGRKIVEMFAGQGIGLAFNMAVAPSAILIPAEAVDWLSGMLGQNVDRQEARPVALHPPVNMSERLVGAIDAKLAAMIGMAKRAYLGEMEYDNRPRTPVLAFVDAPEDAQPQMAAAIGEAVSFTGDKDAAVDVVFLTSSDSVLEQFDNVTLRLDLPQFPEAKEPEPPKAPGSDPEKPPILK